ncbi:hypothetical protein [Streptacidiphilus sp. MAP5-3]|uniref:hypothetical protein n=1 Tax=Streptacidiphilus sp. MAP5-3 TaxID=3156265 RepID=UPI003514C84E
MSPHTRRVAAYAGAGLLGAAGVVEWPVAAAGAAVVWLTQPLRKGERESNAPTAASGGVRPGSSPAAMKPASTAKATTGKAGTHKRATPKTSASTATAAKPSAAKSSRAAASTARRGPTTRPQSAGATRATSKGRREA